MPSLGEAIVELDHAHQKTSQYTFGMRPADLTPVEIADLLARMYEGDHSGQDDAPSPQQRTELADYLGCHEEARASAWQAWSAELNPADWDVIEYWLDVEFVEPCLEGRAV